MNLFFFYLFAVFLHSISSCSLNVKSFQLWQSCYMKKKKTKQTGNQITVNKPILKATFVCDHLNENMFSELNASLFVLVRNYSVSFKSSPLRIQRLKIDFRIGETFRFTLYILTTGFLRPDLTYPGRTIWFVDK